MIAKTALAAAAGTFLIAAAPARAGAEELPGGITPEQVAYLEESLGEGLGAADGKLVGLALEGLKATGKDEGALLASLERAALDAALNYSNFNDRIRIDAWTLAAKARLGDASAAEVLRGWARLPEDAPDGDARVARKAMAQMRVRAARSAEALLCLAYLGADGVRDLAEKILRHDPGAGADDPRRRMMFSSYAAPRVKSAIQILLEPDREEGTRLVLAIIEDEGLSVDHRARMLGACAELVKDDEGADRLASAFRTLVDATIAKGFDERRPDPAMMTLISTVPRYLPKDQQVLEGLETLEAALPKTMQRWVEGRVRMYRRQMGLPEKPEGEEAQPDAARPRPVPGADAPGPAPQGGVAPF